MVTKHAAVIGHPIGQSLSPLLHNRWMKAHRINADYQAIDGQNEAQFQELIRTLPSKGYVGVNVTLPFKRLAYDLADELSETAQMVGAANLLVFRDGKVLGDNTDVSGFSAALDAMDLPEVPKTARILGAGGAAPAIIVALRALGVERVEITNRTASKAIEISDHFGVEQIGWAARDANLEGVNLLINTTSLGMKGQPDLEMHLSRLPDHAAVVDIITTPPETAFLRIARERGLKTMNGLPMLVYQAIPSFEAWFGTRPDDADEALAMIEELA